MQYHSQDIVPIHAKLKYTTLIEVPPTEKIMEAATGDKDFWVVDVVGNFCFVHPAKAGISSNLNLITDKGNIYSFTLQDVSGTAEMPDLKVLVQPADRSSIVASSGPPQYVPAAQLDQSKQQLAAVQSHITQAVDEYKSAYPLALKFDYTFKANEAPFDIQSIYHDDKFTYIKTNAPEKFSVYEMKDGKPNLVNYDLATAPTSSRRSWIPATSSLARSGWTSLARDNRATGNGANNGGDDDELSRTQEPELVRDTHEPKGVLQKNLKPLSIWARRCS